MCWPHFVEIVLLRQWICDAIFMFHFVIFSSIYFSLYFVYSQRWLHCWTHLLTGWKWFCIDVISREMHCILFIVLMYIVEWIACESAWKKNTHNKWDLRSLFFSFSIHNLLIDDWNVGEEWWQFYRKLYKFFDFFSSIDDVKHNQKHANRIVF